MPVSAVKTRTVKIIKANGPGGPALPLEEFTPEVLLDFFGDRISADLSECIIVPPDEDLNEWLAVNTHEFYEISKTVYSAISDACTEACETCREMNAGPNFKYRWQDGKLYKKPTAVSAPQYISLLYQWVSAQVMDETLFPTDSKNPLPKEFPKVIKNIFRRLFRVYAHIFLCHYNVIVERDLITVFNTCLAHFLLFAKTYQLIDPPELEPLAFILRSLDTSSRGPERPLATTGE